MCVVSISPSHSRDCNRTILYQDMESPIKPTPIEEEILQKSESLRYSPEQKLYIKPFLLICLKMKRMFLSHHKCLNIFWEWNQWYKEKDSHGATDNLHHSDLQPLIWLPYWMCSIMIQMLIKSSSIPRRKQNRQYYIKVQSRNE